MRFGPKPQQVLASDGTTTAIPCADAGTVYSKAFSLQQGTEFSLWVKAAGTTPRLDVYLEQGFALPTTEGSADSNWAVPDGASPVVNDIIATDTRIAASIAPAVMPYGRLKIVPNGSNGANTTLTAILGVQSER